MTALLTIAEVADELRLSPDSVRRLVASGKLPVVYPVARGCGGPGGEPKGV